jgi:hypothetical protein
MYFNYAYEKNKFDEEWARLIVEYKNAGFDADSIAKMYEYDWELFKKRRIIAIREQPFPDENIDDDSPHANSTLFIKFKSLSCEFSEADFKDIFGWIQGLDNAELAGKLLALSDGDKELLTLWIIHQKTQTEIAKMRKCTKQSINGKIKRLKKFLRKI